MKLISEYSDEFKSRKLILNDSGVSYPFSKPGLYLVTRYINIKSKHTANRRIGIDESILISNIDSCAYNKNSNINTIPCHDKDCPHRKECTAKFYRCNDKDNDIKITYYLCPITLDLRMATK